MYSVTIWYYNNSRITSQWAFCCCSCTLEWYHPHPSAVAVWYPIKIVFITCKWKNLTAITTHLLIQQDIDVGRTHVIKTPKHCERFLLKLCRKQTGNYKEQLEHHKYVSVQPNLPGIKTGWIRLGILFLWNYYLPVIFLPLLVVRIYSQIS